MKSSLGELHKLREISNDLYYNSDNYSGISDDVYDVLIEVIKEKETGFENPVGATVKQNHAYKLPYYLGSMNKCKEQKDIDRWCHRYGDETEYVIEDKLDGVSCLMIVNPSGVINLFTRGDGSVGTDISHFTKVISNLPDKKKQKMTVAIRGELIMKRTTFEMKYKEKFANARNLISGIINSKTIKEEAYDIDFIPYEIINEQRLSITKQFDILKTMFHTVVNHQIISKDEMITDSLVGHLIHMKQQSDYEIDGIIVHSSQGYTRNTSQNPDYAFAFKTMLDSNIVDTEVEFVEWNVTKWNVFKPRIKISPVNLCGVTIQYTTGFNAKYIQDNQIGAGAIVSITRSNDVIPYIVKVKKPGVVDFPAKFAWNHTGVDILAIDGDNTASIKSISSFFSDLGIKHVSDATVSKMFESGFNTLMKILRVTKEELVKIDGFGEKLAERTLLNIHNSLQQASISDVICASSCLGFGFGKKKIQKLLFHLPHFYLEEESPELLKQIIMIDGFSEVTAKQVVSHIPDVREFVIEISEFISKEEKVEVKVNNDSMSGQNIVFSGFRDKDLEARIVSRGGNVGTSVSKNTTVVVTKDPGDSSSKLKKAREYHIPILQREDFEKNICI
jgi:NAD-dependent DNA ligase